MQAELKRNRRRAVVATGATGIVLVPGVSAFEDKRLPSKLEIEDEQECENGERELGPDGIKGWFNDIAIAMDGLWDEALAESGRMSKSPRAAGAARALRELARIAVHEITVARPGPTDEDLVEFESRAEKQRR